MSRIVPQIREARFSEQRQFARIATAGFWDDNLFGGVIHPKANEFPLDAQFYWLRRFRVSWWDYTHRFVVSTVADEQGKEVMTGMAQWTRFGAGGKKMQCWWFDPRNLMKPLMQLCMRVAAYIWPNRAADPVNEDIIERAHDYSLDVWSGPRAESWYLETLAVSPEYQGRGHGRALVEWGMEKAERENVSASVISAHGKERFYGKCGFNIPAGDSTAGEGNPLAGIPGGLIFFRDAKG